MEFVLEKVNEYYIKLNADERNLFNKNVNLDELIIENNYYLFKKKNENEDFIILLINTGENKLYYLNAID